jgi:hypothetical protein
LDNTCTFVFVQKHSKDKRHEKKNTKSKRVRKLNVSTSSSPQVVQVFVAETKDLVHALAFTSFRKLASLQINLELVP